MYVHTVWMYVEVRGQSVRISYFYMDSRDQTSGCWLQNKRLYFLSIYYCSEGYRDSNI